MGKAWCDDFPPSMAWNLGGHAPTVYYYFWSICGAILFILIFLLVPHMYKIRRMGDLARRRQRRVFIPRAFTYVFCLNLMPLLFTIFNFVILLSPSSVYAMHFAIHCYEAFAFFIFQKLITLYLGGPENAIKLMSSYPPKKIWAAFPLCCCWIFCYPCIPHSHLSMSTFRHLYVLVLQFVFLMPLLAFLEVIKGYTDDDESFLKAIMFIRLTSIVLCVYALIVYMKAASEPLLEYRVRGKFWVMKLTVIFASFVETAIGLWNDYIREVKHYNDEYGSEVMTSALAACVSCCFMLPLGFLVKKVFNVNDCDLNRPVHISQDAGSIRSILDISGTTRNQINNNYQTDYGSDRLPNEILKEGGNNGNGIKAMIGLDKSKKSKYRLVDENDDNDGSNNSNSNSNSNNSNNSNIGVGSQAGSEIEIRKTSITFKRSVDDS